MVPHITNAIQDWVEKVAHIPVGHDQQLPDVCIIEVCLLVYTLPRIINCNQLHQSLHSQWASHKPGAHLSPFASRNKKCAELSGPLFSETEC